ncbi:hypothetical protein Ccrd_020837 [Cynara cardunculus var. scolymus]|uniref:Uncharacterized protein n=1 Tax=Cynara cardunculus var. scolymus TaxID=59895 RepID=A0A118K0Q1_CYNCS|nr:hypothetical protein Ccrd_020837 [Cynara cardunculus var. scolymus]
MGGFQARMQEMKEKEVNYNGNGDANSHVYKECFESPTTTMLLPCGHFSYDLYGYLVQEIFGSFTCCWLYFVAVSVHSLIGQAVWKKMKGSSLEMADQSSNSSAVEGIVPYQK